MSGVSVWVFVCHCGHVASDDARSTATAKAQAHALERHGALLPDGVVATGLRGEPGEDFEIAQRGADAEVGYAQAGVPDAGRDTRRGAGDDT
jgi:hypothetical protein